MAFVCTRFLRRLMWVVVVSVGACGGGGVTGQSDNPPAVSAAVSGNISTAVVSVPPEELVAPGSVTSGPLGGLIVQSDGPTVAKLKVGAILYVPASATSGMQVPFMGRVTAAQSSAGQTTLTVSPVGAEDVFSRLTWDLDTGRPGTKIAGLIAPPNAKVSFSLSPNGSRARALSAKQSIAVDGAKISGSISISRDIVYMGKTFTVFADVQLSDVGARSKGTYDVDRFLASQGWAEISAVVSGKVTGTVGIRGDGAVPILADLISTSDVWGDLRWLGGSVFSLEGLNGADKKGRFPLGGLIVIPGVAATTFTGNLPDAALKSLSVAPSLVVWVYADASGEITISGEAGGRVIERAFEQGYEFKAVGAQLQATRINNGSVTRVELYGKGSVVANQRLGLSVAADVLVGGIRPANVNAFMGAEYTGSIEGDGAWVVYPTTELAGSLCATNKVWAGAELNASFRLKGNLSADVYFTTVSVSDVVERSYSDKVATWLDKDLGSACVTTGAFALTDAVTGPDPATPGNAIVDLNFASAYGNTIVRSLTDKWVIRASGEAFADQEFEIPAAKAGLDRISLPTGRDYTLTLEARSTEYGVVKSTTATLNLNDPPVVDFAVELADADCKRPKVLPLVTNLNGKVIGYKLDVLQNGVSVANIVATTLPLDPLLLPACGVMTFSLTVATDRDKSTTTARNLDTSALVPTINAVTTAPSTPVVGIPATFTVTGQRLQPGYTFTLPGCTAMEIAGASTTQRQFTCTPTQAGTALAGEIRTAGSVLLMSFATDVAAPPLPTRVNITAIATGSQHTCALTESGGVKCWGNNRYGQLGDGTTIDRLAATDVAGLTSGVRQIAAGQLHTCAVLTSGAAKCWGWNGDSQLGDGTATDRALPVDVSGLSGGVTAVSAGPVDTCALLDSGGIKCWGFGPNGQIGDGTTGIVRATPVDVAGVTDAVAITAGANTCALTLSHGVMCWGRSIARGPTGPWYFDDEPLPASVAGLATGVAAIRTGAGHTCALTLSGGIKCWGANVDGQLGSGTYDTPLGTSETNYTLIDVLGLTTDAVSIATPGLSTCALLRTGGVRCWGLNNAGQVGSGAVTSVEGIPVDVSVLGVSATVLSTGSSANHTCVSTSAGGAKCWGANDGGQLGDGTIAPSRATPVDVLGL